MAKRLIALDYETFLINTDYPAPYFFQNIAPIPVCMSSQERRQEAYLHADWDAMHSLTKGWIKSDSVTLVGQNIAFDLFVAVTHLDIPIEWVFDKYNKGLVRDTMIREILLDLATGDAVRNPGKDNSLAGLVEKYLGKDISATKGEDAWRLRYSELYQVPLEEWPDEAVEYPLDDARHTLQVFAHQHKHRKHFQANELAQTRAAWDLHLLSSTCPRVDGKAVHEFIENHSKQVDVAQAPLIRKGILKPNKDRHKQYPKDDPRRAGYSMDTKLLKRLVQADYTAQGKVVPATPSGDISLAGDTLCGCRNKYLRQYGESATSVKMMTGFAPSLLKALEHPNQQITTRYGVILKTGRTSSSKVNLQQLPKAPGARECFIPPEGKVFAAIDYSSMEMYALAQTVYKAYGVRKLLDTLNSGKDPHLMAASSTMGIPYEEALKRYNEGDELTEEHRQFGKLRNFGFGGGLGAATTLSLMSADMIDLLTRLYPGQHLESVLKDSIAQWKDQWELTGHFNKIGRLCQGGKRPTYTCPTTGRIKALNTYCQMCNSFFQPIAADALKESLALIQESAWIPGRELHSMGVMPALEVHDEILSSGPVDNLEQWTSLVSKMMVDGARKVLPDCNIQTDVQVTGDRWRKKGWTVSDYLDKVNA